jgi:HTH-type transcriptional regulator/antitoxin HigA
MPKNKLYPYFYEGEPIPPGPSILETIEYHGLTKKELAVLTGYTTPKIDKIMRGESPVTVEFAMLLERILGMSAEFLLRLETDYQRQKLLQAKKTILRAPAICELRKRGIISNIVQADEIEAVLKFYKAGTLDALDKLQHDTAKTLLKQKRASKNDRLSLIAWLRLCEIEAEKIKSNVYSASKFRVALRQLRALTVEVPNVFLPKLVQICAEAGVAVVCVPEFPLVYVKGAAKWLTEDKAMIALNLHENTNDIFWFTFFHEAAHILLDKKQFLSNYSELLTAIMYSEENMDRFAEQQLIPEKYNEQLKNLKAEQDILTFAQKIGIEPGIVVGRLQHDKILPTKKYNNLKQTFAWSNAYQE